MITGLSFVDAADNNPLSIFKRLFFVVLNANFTVDNMITVVFFVIFVVIIVFDC